jgi:Protein of unknown function (DUF3097)
LRVLDRYGTDVLGPGRRKPRSTEHAAEIGLVVEDVESGYVGAVVCVEYGRIYLEDRRGHTRGFPLGPGYLLEGRPVILTAPRRAASAVRDRTASGSVAVPNARARVARASRIYVEGRHDAELVAQVWGADLRIEGVVVEELGGVDGLVDIVAEFSPRPGRRLGVLVDHLVAGSKEARIADAVRRGSGGTDTLVVGHPYVDIWQAVKPERVGLSKWPVIPPGVPWKEGICRAVGVREPADMWRRILKSVNTYKDVETPLINSMERLIDFVTEARD